MSPEGIRQFRDAVWRNYIWEVSIMALILAIAIALLIGWFVWWHKEENKKESRDRLALNEMVRHLRRAADAGGTTATEALSLALDHLDLAITETARHNKAKALQIFADMARAVNKKLDK